MCTYMDRVVTVVGDMNVGCLRKGWKLANGHMFEINYLLFVNDAALVADSEKFLTPSECVW